MIPQSFPLSTHRSIKIRFAYRFLRALKKLNNRRTAASPTTSRRYHMVKRAAYASMASAVGSKRAWSRALLWKIRNNRSSAPSSSRRTHHRVVAKRCKARSGSIFLTLKKNSCMNINENPSKVVDLQKLVPGGEMMDYSNLLDETTHYIKCLSTQVQIMRNLVEFYSARSLV